MIDHRPASSLGHLNFGWLDTTHHFSFGEYHEPRRMGWGALRVWNDDEIAPGSGFPPHPHANMEIITYVRDGAITHKDSLGNTGRTEAGDVQVMSAGSGIRHAEYNLEGEATRIFQIWILPDRAGGPPAWGRAGDADALPIRADARVSGATLKAGESLTYALGQGRHAYLVPAKGEVEVNGVRVPARDGLAAADLDALTITALSDSELVLVDVA